MKKSKLKIGDTVLWSGSWGYEQAKKAKVESIEYCRSGSQDGEELDEIDWDLMKTRNVIVTLDNDHWAYAFQIRKV